MSEGSESAEGLSLPAALMEFELEGEGGREGPRRTPRCRLNPKANPEAPVSQLGVLLFTRA